MRRLLTALVVSFLPAVASAQMASGPDVGYKREAGMVSSALPAPLREIGFDQNIGQRLPLDTPVRDQDGRIVPGDLVAIDARVAADSYVGGVGRTWAVGVPDGANPHSELWLKGYYGNVKGDSRALLAGRAPRV